MAKTINIENAGITNSARAVDNNAISVSKLLEVAGFSVDNIIADIVFAANQDEDCSIIRPIEERVAEKIYSVIQVAKGWRKSGYEVVN